MFTMLNWCIVNKESVRVVLHLRGLLYLSAFCGLVHCVYEHYIALPILSYAWEIKFLYHLFTHLICCLYQGKDIGGSRTKTYRIYIRMRYRSRTETICNEKVNRLNKPGLIKHKKLYGFSRKLNTISATGADICSKYKNIVDVVYIRMIM